MDARLGDGPTHTRARDQGTSRLARRCPARVGIEALESRQLLSGLIDDVPALPSGVKAGPMVVSALAKLYYVETGNSGGAKLGVITAAAKTSEVDLPSSDVGGAVVGLAADSEGDVWYSYASNTAVRTSLTSAPVVNVVGEVTPSGAVHEFTLPNAGDQPGRLTLGSDGNIWVSVSNASRPASLARVTPSGSVTEFPVAGATKLGWPTAGPDGNLWFTDGTKIGKMTTTGVVTEYSLPASTDGSPIDLSNAQLTGASDGNIWFIGLGGVSKITPSGVVTTSSTPGSTITALSTASDGNLWFSFLPTSDNSLSAEPGAVVIRMNPDGSTVQIPGRAGDAGTTVTSMAPGHDASLWINDGGTKISRINLSGVPTFAPPIVYPTTTTGITTDANGSFSGKVVSFTAYDTAATASDFTATINWGDGNTSPGTITANQNGGYDVTGSNTFKVPAGTIENITVTVQENARTAQVFNQVQVAGTGSTPVQTTPIVALGKGHHTPAEIRAAAKANAAARLAARKAALASHPKGPATHRKPGKTTTQSPNIPA